MSLEILTGLGYGGAHLNTTLPKVLAELQGHTISGPLAGAAANTAIAVADGGGIDIQDTLQKVVMTSLTQSGTTPFAVTFAQTDVTAHCSIVDRRATGTVTCLNTIADGDYVTVNGKKYTFKNLGTVTPSTLVAPYAVPVTIAAGVCDVNKAAASLAAAIMSGDSTLTCTVALGVVSIFVRVAGTAGNAVTLTTSGAHATVSGAGTLAGGSATNAIKCSDNTTGNTLMVFWYNKSNVTGQW